MEMILPPGFLFNTAETYKEVAGYNTVPLDKIYGFWRIYTTTHRKLIDPRARRLENFWWHVWGSDRCKLSGPQLAKLFEDISTGPLVDLPPRRAVQPRPPRLSDPSNGQDAPDSQSAEAAPPTPQSDDDALQEGSALEDQPPVKDLLSSSSKPPPKHSILKKPRGPSTSGPRPTARFAEPPPSGEEDNKDSGDSSSGAAATAPDLDQPPEPSSSKPGKKPVSAAPKKYVASTSVSKRRPQLPRRLSSQSSTGSDAGSREAPSPTSAHPGRLRYSPATITEEPLTITTTTVTSTSSRRSPFRSQGSSGSSSQSERPTLSAKAAGKRPMRPSPDAAPTLRSSQTLADRGTGPVIIQAYPATQPSPLSEEARPAALEYEVHTARHEGALRGDGSTPSEALARPGPGSMPPPAQTSLPGPEVFQPREMGSSGLLPQGLVSSSVAATSKVEVQGTFDFEDPSKLLMGPAEAHDLPDELTMPSRASSASLRDMRFTPTLPSSTPPVPLGRSKSQLTLLLEREKERLGGDWPMDREKGREDGKSDN